MTVMKKIGILGTGIVGKTIGNKLIELGYKVMMGSRTKSNETAREWVALNGANASEGSFSDATLFGDIIFNCTKGDSSIKALQMARPENFKGRIVIDLANPLDFSQGMPPSLLPQFSNTTSLGEMIHKLLPEAHVVKTLNMVNCEVMVDAKKSGGDPTMFICGNDEEAKKEVTSLLNQFGWIDIIDLGDISAARGTEMMLPIWLRTWQATGNGHFGFKIVR